MIEAFTQLSALGWGNIVLVFLLSIAFVAGFLQVKKYICDYFGIETKRSLREKKRDEEIADLKAGVSNLKEDIKKFNDNRTHDREQSFQIQGQLVDKLSDISKSLLDIKEDIIVEKLERKRWNILNFADELRRPDSVADDERFNNVFRDYDDYEKIISEKDLRNGFVEESFKFIRLKYQEMLNNR